MNIAVIGSGITGMRISSRLYDLGHKVTVITRGENLLNQFGKFNYDKGGHVYGLSAIRAIVERGIPIDTTNVMQRKAYYLHRMSERTYQWIPYPVQSSGGIAVKDDVRYRGQSLREFSEESFGKEFTDQWFAPFNTRVWSTDISEMDCDWIVGRVQTPKALSEGSNWGPNNLFVYVNGYDLIAPLKRDLNYLVAEVMFINTKREIIVQGQHGYADSLRTLGPYDAIFNTMPLGDLVGRVFCLPTLQILGDYTKMLRVNYVTSIGIELDIRCPKNFSWVYHDLDARVHRTTLLSRYRNANCERDYILCEVPSLLPFIPKHSKDKDNDQIWKALADPLRSIRVYRQNLRFIDTTIDTSIDVCVHLGYPIPMRGSRAYVAKVKEELLWHKVYTAGRWGSHGYFNVDHALMDADAAVDFFLANGTGEGIRKNYLNSAFYYK